MKITIGKFDAKTNTVTVTFVHAGVTHRRAVNACLTEGKYDKAATEARVAEVAAGVEHKIAIGAITNPEPLPEVPAPE